MLIQNYNYKILNLLTKIENIRTQHNHCFASGGAECFFIMAREKTFREYF